MGILGGTFNPPHIGHLICAQEALVQLALDTVVWVPAGVPPHREVEDDPGAEARFAMCELAVSGDERFSLSRVELEREGPSYTVDTLRGMRSSAGDGDELFLILGGDQAASLRAWREPEEVLTLATIAVVERTGWPRPAIGVTLSGLRGAERLVFFDMPRVDVSSSMVRRRAREGKPIRYLVADRVADYIGAQSLYGASTPVAASK
ncbi:MAG TPA: nicotinate-nucleotide adenylyltransferase [Thermoleophilaceae bacterium]